MLLVLCKHLIYREVSNMGLNRMMMKSNEKDIEAEMIVGYSGDLLGFMNDVESFGQLSPNPLSNGVRVSSVTISSDGTAQLRPATIKSCTLKEIDVTFTHGEIVPIFVISYIAGHGELAIPIIFHF